MVTCEGRKGLIIKILKKYHNLENVGGGKGTICWGVCVDSGELGFPRQRGGARGVHRTQGRAWEAPNQGGGAGAFMG